MRKRWYVGYTTSVPPCFQEFSSEKTPSGATHGKQYCYVIGPFRTKRGAVFMAKQGLANPLCPTVSKAEKLAKQE